MSAGAAIAAASRFLATLVAAELLVLGDLADAGGMCTLLQMIDLHAGLRDDGNG
jgi:hypothetical protein